MTKIIDSVQKKGNQPFLYGDSLKSLVEGLRIDDLKKNAISDRNKYWLGKRRSDGNTGSFLEAAYWDKDKNGEDVIVIEFSVKEVRLMIFWASEVGVVPYLIVKVELELVSIAI